MRSYYLDHVLFSIVAAITAALTARSWSWGAWWVTGVAFGTLAEYWVHRLVLHRLMWNSTHERHHTHPKEYSELPVWLTPAIFGGSFFVLPVGMFCGFVCWYVWFLCWHDALHHWDLVRRPLIRQYANWHLVHHRGHSANYGITIPLWDWVFGSYRLA